MWRAPLERAAHRVDRERPERGDAEGADAQPGLASLVHHVLDRPEHRAHGDDDHLRVGAAVGVHEPARVAPERLRELCTQLPDAPERGQLAGVGQVADFLERLGPHHGSDGIGVGGVEHLARLVGRKERVHLRLAGQVDPLGCVGEDESVHAHHHRDRQLLGQAEGLDVQVCRLLDRLREELDPAGIAGGHGVAVVVPDIDRRANSAVGQRHDDGQPEPAGVVDGLHHEEEPLAGGGGEGAGPGGGGADGHRHGGELRLHVDELARRELAYLHHLAQRLDYVGLWGNGVGAHDLGSAQRHCFRDGPRTLNLPEHRASPFRWRS